MNLINIITPCTRIKNLIKIEESIQSIPKENRRWIIVFDLPYIPDNAPEDAECYAMQDEESIVGNAQRNFALDRVKDGWIYFNDDDTVIHEDLWKKIKDLDNDFISFMQETKRGDLRLSGDTIKVNHIDSHNFMFSYSLLGDTRFIKNKYDADGYFAEEIRKKSKSPFYIQQILSTYNSLR